MNQSSILIRYHEIALKGSNRGWFEDRLAQNARALIQRELGNRLPINVYRRHGRILIDGDFDDAALKAACNALSRVFGISSYSPMRSAPTEMEAIKTAAIEEFEKYLTMNPMPRTFRVFTRRSDKALPMTSMEIDRSIGLAINEKYPDLQVSLNDPQMTVGVEIRFKNSFIWRTKIPGPGGLPVGTGGKVLTMLSGGIDSPVAAIRMIKRGSVSSFVHFHGVPYVGDEVLNKVKDLAAAVNRFQPDPQPLHIVPFGRLQEQIARLTNPKLRTLLYRRMMVRIASEISNRAGAQGIVTGDSLGQVASQTMENIRAVEDAATALVFRPLIAMDKEEIIASARLWNTFEASIQEGADCCTLFADRHPSIRADIAEVEEQEKRFSVQDLTTQALSELTTHRFK